jgi:V/A-type H+-transporting ATPase subunit D
MKQTAYNKIALQQLQKALKMRLAALPVIRSKESALRMEVKQQQQALIALQQAYQQSLHAAAAAKGFWLLWQRNALKVETYSTSLRNFAGVKLPRLAHLQLSPPDWQAGDPVWELTAYGLLRDLIEKRLLWQLKEQEITLLEAERKRTTQKLNLFEKVQIPAFEDQIRKIKRFLEDEENLVKATQKLVKQKREEAA